MKNFKKVACISMASATLFQAGGGLIANASSPSELIKNENPLEFMFMERYVNHRSIAQFSSIRTSVMKMIDGDNKLKINHYSLDIYNRKNQYEDEVRKGGYIYDLFNNINFYFGENGGMSFEDFKRVFTPENLKKMIDKYGLKLNFFSFFTDSSMKDDVREYIYKTVSDVLLEYSEKELRVNGLKREDVNNIILRTNSFGGGEVELTPSEKYHLDYTVNVNERSAVKNVQADEIINNCVAGSGFDGDKANELREELNKEFKELKELETNGLYYDIKRLKQADELSHDALEKRAKAVLLKLKLKYLYEEKLKEIESSNDIADKAAARLKLLDRYDFYKSESQWLYNSNDRVANYERGIEELSNIQWTKKYVTFKYKGFGHLGEIVNDIDLEPNKVSWGENKDGNVSAPEEDINKIKRLYACEWLKYLASDYDLSYAFDDFSDLEKYKNIESIDILRGGLDEELTNRLYTKIVDYFLSMPESEIYSKWKNLKLESITVPRDTKGNIIYLPNDRDNQEMHLKEINEHLDDTPQASIRRGLDLEHLPFNNILNGYVKRDYIQKFNKALDDRVTGDRGADIADLNNKIKNSHYYALERLNQDGVFKNIRLGLENELDSQILKSYLQEEYNNKVKELNEANCSERARSKGLTLAKELLDKSKHEVDTFFAEGVDKSVYFTELDKIAEILSKKHGLLFGDYKIAHSGFVGEYLQKIHDIHPVEVTVPKKVIVKNKTKLTNAEREKVKKALESANNFPEGTHIDVGYEGDSLITYPDGSKDTINGDELVETKSNTSYIVNTIVNTVFNNKVKRISGNDRYETAVRVSNEVNKSDTVFLVNAKKYTDSLTCVPYANLLNAPILFTNDNSIPKATLDRLNDMKPKNIIIVGGENSVSKNVFDALNKMANKTIRIAGNDRYETSKKIADEVLKLNSTSKEAIIVSGEVFADALSSSGLAVNKNIPILLSKNNDLVDSTESILKNNEFKNIYLVGGRNSVSDGVLNEINHYVKSSKRLSGNDRYETSSVVAGEVKHGNTGVFASGEVFADALVSGSIAGKYKAPILLTAKDNVSESVKHYVKKSSMKNIIVVGGSDVVGDGVLKTLENLID